MSGDPLTAAGDIVSLGRVLFSHAELACRASGVVKLHPGFAEALALLRMSLGRPMTVTSCCRSAAHNAAVGGHPASLHVYDRPHNGAKGSCAIDIARGAPAFNVELADLALKQGWSVGVAKRFIHLDRRRDIGLPQNVFGY